MAAAAVLAGLPPCLSCAGGGEINGVTCRDCGGRKRLRVPSLRGSVRARLHGWSLRAAGAAGTAVRWSAAVPGIAGAAGVSLGAAMVVHGVFHQVPLLGVAALVAGVFGLAADRRL